MAGTVHTDSDDEPCIVRPVCKIKPTAALLEHSEKVALPSQTRAINAFHAAEAAKRTTDVTHPPAAELPQAPILSQSAPAPIVDATDATTPGTTSKRARVEEVDEDEISGDEEREVA
ncbi:hypothetical protein F4604DRAFT_1936106 [Suillus subluteus]|nr:hypothetical protein F4604DRAFT_1936106 [Suillus subluteus]